MERGRSPDEIIVVAGVPRSGTSLVMQMLAAGGLALLCDGVRAPDDDNPRGYFELEAAKRLASDASWLPSARGRAVKIVHALVPELPSHHSYRVLLVERRLDEVLASQDRMLARGGRERDALAPGGSNDRLAVVFAGQLEAVRRWLDARPNVLWLPIRHADLIAQPEVCATRIDDFLGGSLDRVAMAGAVEPKLHRVRASDLPGNA